MEIQGAGLRRGIHAGVLERCVIWDDLDHGAIVPRFRTGGALLLSLIHISEHVVIIDARHLDPMAVVGPAEVASAISGKCRALLVFGSVYDVGKLAKERTMPVYALDNSPRVLRAEGGRIEAALLDCEAGLITSDYYITGDADAIVAVRREQMQAHFAVP